MSAIWTHRHHSITPPPAPAGETARRRSIGQAVVEFAIILPILLSLLGIALDFSRVYIVDLDVQAAARNAAEQVASDVTIGSQAAAQAKAQQLVCYEIQGTSACTGSNQPVAMVTSFSLSSTAPGATAQNPIATVTVRLVQPFDMIFPWPFMTPPGHWDLSAQDTFSIVRGR